MTTEDENALLLRRYIVDQTRTATPVQRLLMLFDQLRRYLHCAEVAFTTRDFKEISDNLVHAQHILFALRDPLDQATELGRSLSGVYGFCLNRLVEANIRKDPTLLTIVQTLIDRIAAANHAAAAAMSAQPAPAASVVLEVVHADEQEPDEDEWDEALAAMEAHLAEIRIGLEHQSTMPELYTVGAPAKPLPARLLDRARLLAAGQRDVEIALRERVGILGSALHRDPLAERATISLYVDRRA